MRRAREAARLLRHAGPALAASLLAMELAAAALPLAVIAVIGVTVGRVASGGAIAGPLAALSVLLLAQQVLGPFRAAVAYRVTRRVDGTVRSLTMEAANRSLSVAPLEDPATLDQLELAGGITEPFWNASPGGAAVATLTLAARYLQVAGAAILLARVSVPLAALLTAVVLVTYQLSRRWQRVRMGAIRDNLMAGRHSRYTSGLANTPAPAKEVRLFGLLDWLLPRFQSEWDALVAARVGAGRWATTRVVTAITLTMPVVAVAFVAVARTAVGDGLEPRDIAVALQAAVALFSVLLDPRGDDAYQMDFGLESLEALRAIDRRMGGAVVRGDDAHAGAGADGLPRRAIAFEGVRFAYPGSGREVFAGLDLTIPAGSSLAIVGANGAGKTTLVKLLARLYEPQGGVISVDGVPLDELDPLAWRRRLAVIFQDFVRYQLPAADNVGFGGAGRVDDVGRALDVAASRAGALDVVRRLPAGWDTPLSRQYAGGADLSGGEWQRVALARALFAVEAGAGVLVLDEPTANLDVRAEAALFEEFLELTSGLTTILISHRFSTVRRADRICVLEQGRVAEEGSHAELVAAGGRYDELFRLQAARFRD